MIKFYYGLSGTFKTSTIMSERSSIDNALVVWSMIKRWKDLESSVFDGMTKITDLNFAMLHLCNLENTIKNEPKNILVERGITDMLYYWLRQNKYNGKSNWIVELVKKELDLCENKDIEKVLLIQSDVNFIKNVILKEKTRAAVFPGGVDEYLKEQEEYINFTKQYNNITNIVEITNAETYLKNLINYKNGYVN